MAEVTHEMLLDEARRKVAARLQDKRLHEQQVNKDIETMQSRIRTIEMKRYIASMGLTYEPPRKGDMSFWRTRIGDPPCIRTPEEQRGAQSRVKCTKVPEYENNCFRAHALHNFVYWMRRDETLRLSRRLMKVRGDSLHLISCNSLGSLKPEWKDVRF